MVKTIDEKISLIKELNKLDDYDFRQELGGIFLLTKTMIMISKSSKKAVPQELDTYMNGQDIYPNGTMLYIFI